MADLFSEAARERQAENAPLAVRLRPSSLDDLVGQQHVLAPGSALRRAIEEDRPPSMILFGPPGTGKTTIARIVAERTGAAFEEISAVSARVDDVRAVIARARDRLGGNGLRTILFIDEIHRFNKAQQDAFLPRVEAGDIVLIGATTENPSFEVNSALLSRTQLYELSALGAPELEVLLRRALADPERGIADPPEVEGEAIELLATRSGGDARTALAALELASDTARAGGHPVTVETAEDALQRKAVTFDKQGDRHYDYASALIKAMRGSDPDASIYYLAAMLEGGEDPRFIARRMVILAAEDIGNADPQALLVATAAAQAVDRVGLPECAINLAQAAAYLALAPKSNASVKAIAAAQRYVGEHGAKLPPDYLRDAHYPGAKKLGRGTGYVYPHDQPGGVADQPLLPPEVQGERFYEPTDRGLEAELGKRLARIREKLDRDR